MSSAQTARWGPVEYRDLTAARTAALIRNTRRLARRLAARLGGARSLRTYPHGLYFALAPGGDLRLKDVKRAAQALCDAVAAQRLPVKHAGSFGFDFVAVEWFFDALLRRNVLRIAGADLPRPTIDAIGDAIADWWAPHRIGRSASSSAGATLHPAPLP